jgi:DHA1 family bicyclomycin/chloramphenicol resistance-like MFS transporter
MNNLKQLGQVEFVALMALLMSLTALGIDAILPALPIIGTKLGVLIPNDNQKMISFLFLGLTFGQLFFGPLSDSFGRKKLIYFGVGIFILGCIISLLAKEYNTMLIGRIIQGIGLASTRVIPVAMVRDQFSGNKMAKIMSLITMVFIIVPALAPSFGQLILHVYNWQAIFWMFLILSSISISWFMFRQPETLPIDKRSEFSAKIIGRAFLRSITNRSAMGYTITSGYIFGAFIGYLVSSQQIFTVVFNAGERFPIYFGLLALAIGGASYINSKLVERLGMRKLVLISLCLLILISIGFTAYSIIFQENPSLVIFLVFMMSIFSCVGILFGNCSSLAIEPLGDIAGSATAVINSIQNLISLTLGSLIGGYFNGTTIPMAIGFTLLGVMALFSMLWTEKFNFSFLKNAVK